MNNMKNLRSMLHCSFSEMAAKAIKPCAPLHDQCPDKNDYGLYHFTMF